MKRVRPEAGYLFPKNKEIAKNQSQYEEILDQLEDNLFDIVIVEINSNGEFAGLRKNSKGLTHLEQRLVLEENELSLTAESILDSKEIIAIMVDDNDETLTEMLEGKKKAVDFPAKVLMAHPNLRIYYHSTF